jgi:hypothetical protein
VGLLLLIADFRIAECAPALPSRIRHHGYTVVDLMKNTA